MNRMRGREEGEVYRTREGGQVYRMREGRGRKRKGGRGGRKEHTPMPSATSFSLLQITNLLWEKRGRKGGRKEGEER